VAVKLSKLRADDVLDLPYRLRPASLCWYAYCVVSNLEAVSRVNQ
jgi:hypothetical protein